MKRKTSDRRVRYESNIPKYYIYSGLTEFSGWLILAIYVIYLQQERGLTLTQVGLMDGIFWITMTFSEVPTGIVADRFSRKLSLIIGTILSSLGFLLYGLAPSFYLLVLANIIWGIGITFKSGANEALLYESLRLISRENEYTKITGRAMAIRHSMVAASVIGGLLASTNLASPFIVGAVLQASSLLILFTLKEPKKESKDAIVTRMSYGAILGRSLQLMRDRPRLLYAVLYLTVIPTAWFVVGVFFLQPKAISLGVPIALIGVVVMAVNGTSVAGSLLAAKVGKFFGEKRVLYGVPLTLTICLILIGSIQTVLILTVIAALSFLAVLIEPLVKNIIQNEVSNEIRATVLSLQSLLFTLFLAVTEPSLGFIADRFELSATYFTLAGIFAIFTITLFWKGRECLNSNHTNIPQN